MLEIACLKYTLDGATLVPEIRKPFDVLAEGHLSENSRDKKTAIELFVTGLANLGSNVRRHFLDRNAGML